MSLLRGAHLAAYLLGAPGAAGTAAHLLTSKYLNLMNFEGNYFLVKAVTELYDSGIPKIPESIKNAVEQIVKQLQVKTRKKRETSPSPKAEAPKQEVFKDKKYWCRYFDYSRGPQNVIMEYDKNCVLYNIFEVKGQEAAKPEAVKASAEGQAQNSASNEGKTYDISAINNKEKTINTLKLSENKDFLKGAFYLLSLDKNKFSRLNTLTHIELTEVGTERLAEQTYQKKIATLKIKAPMKGDIKDLSLSFAENKLPSSVLLLKKIKKPATAQVQAAAASGNGGDSSGNSTKTYFLQKQAGNGSAGIQVAKTQALTNNGKGDKLQVLGMWEFPPTLKNKDKPSKLDLRYLDKVLWNEIQSDTAKTPYPRLGLIGSLLDGILKLTGNGSNGSDYEKYFVAKTLSDFWDYKVGDKVQLIETSETKAAAAVKASITLVSTGDSQQAQATDKNLAEFEVVSGLLVHLNSPIQCIPNSSTSTGELVNLPFKRNFAKSANGVFSEKKNSFYCKPPQNGLPPYTMIFLGNSISELDKNVSSEGGAVSSR